MPRDEVAAGGGVGREHEHDRRRSEPLGVDVPARVVAAVHVLEVAVALLQIGPEADDRAVVVDGRGRDDRGAGRGGEHAATRGCAVGARRERGPERREVVDGRDEAGGGDGGEVEGRAGPAHGVVRGREGGGVRGHRLEVARPDAEGLDEPRARDVGEAAAGGLLDRKFDDRSLPPE
jgi:hypothetical protein